MFLSHEMLLAMQKTDFNVTAFLQIKFCKSFNAQNH